MVIEEVCRNAEVLADEKNIRLQIAFLESVQILGDPVRIRQMIWNIVHNGIKYTPSGGEVKVSLADRNNTAFITIQ
ncbi:MAG: histidine kinase, partial [Nitrospinaceae bacterium]|nr:histidine kinase [Nitrospinaceae bacterium]NIT84352.1 histidine kinase [Nitrospinaceae bacterium]NIW08097.1 histidine kinase [Nitrospinaceae bacterium]NIX36700.1 histidine kinase [Nitrospinaceae bacterium]NIY17803.1 histidine kinase [Nitrospinaceae bacterium]